MMQLKLMGADSVQAIDPSVVFYASLASTMDAEISVSAVTYNSRASSATYVDRHTGLVESAVSNESRFESDGMLVEKTSTNAALYSNDFTQADWIAAGSSVTAGAITGPDGDTTGSKLECTEDEASYAFVAQFFATPPSCFSVYAKAGNYTSLIIKCSDSVSFHQLTDQWQRFFVGCAAGSDVDVAFGLGSGEPVAEGSYIYVAFADVDMDDEYPSSYTPTTTAAAARAPEIMAWGAANVPTLAGNWSVAVDVKRMQFGQDDPSGSCVYVGNVSGIAAQIRITDLGEIILYCNAATITSSAGLSVPGEWNRVIMTGNGTNCRLFVDGLQIGATTAHGGTPLAATEFQVNANVEFSGHVRNLATYTKYADSSSAPYL